MITRICDQCGALNPTHLLICEECGGSVKLKEMEAENP
jgi:ribosomal protein L40E